MKPTVFAGNVWFEPGVERSGKNAVSFESYPKDFFPSFCGGLAYFMTMLAVRKLVEHIKGSDFLWLDDVYITGQNELITTLRII